MTEASVVRSIVDSRIFQIVAGDVNGLTTPMTSIEASMQTIIIGMMTIHGTPTVTGLTGGTGIITIAPSPPIV